MQSQVCAPCVGPVQNQVFAPCVAPVQNLVCAPCVGPYAHPDIAMVPVSMPYVALMVPVPFPASTGSIHTSPAAPMPLPAPTRPTESSLAAAPETSASVSISTGSLGHPFTCAEACKYWRRQQGCKDGALCDHCHLCVPKRQSGRKRT